MNLTSVKFLQDKYKSQKTDIKGGKNLFTEILFAYKREQSWEQKKIKKGDFLVQQGR